MYKKSSENNKNAENKNTLQEIGRKTTNKISNFFDVARTRTGNEL